LRHYLGDALRISGEICELRGGQRSGGEQHEAKFCHDNPEIPKNLQQETKALVEVAAINS
jgi:hypothetical protein